MKYILSLAFVVVLFTSCSKYKFSDISEFRIDTLALQEAEPVKIYYASNGPDENNDLEYYFHIIAISQLDGDTVNILTPRNNDFKATDKDSIFNFIKDIRLLSAIINKAQDGELDELIKENNGDINSILENSSSPKPILKVVRDPEFDKIARNNYPTIIGMIGKASVIPKTTE